LPAFVEAEPEKASESWQISVTSQRKCEMQYPKFSFYNWIFVLFLRDFPLKTGMFN